MTRTQTELTYLRASIESASSVDLVIILYDMLISDLRGALEALANNDIERRSRELKHAFLVLEQLEASVDMNSGADAALPLARFYSVLRANIMDGHVKASADILNRQIEALFEVRATWADVATRRAAATTPPANQAEELHPSASVPVLAGSWSV